MIYLYVYRPENIVCMNFTVIRVLGIIFSAVKERIANIELLILNRYYAEKRTFIVIFERLSEGR